MESAPSFAQRRFVPPFWTVQTLVFFQYTDADSAVLMAISNGSNVGVLQLLRYWLFNDGILLIFYYNLHITG